MYMETESEAVHDKARRNRWPNKMAMSEVYRLGIGGLRTGYAAGDFSPVDVARQHFERISRFNPTLNAFIALDRKRALSDAAASEIRYREDKQLPLDGIPVAVKANIAVEGLEHNAGMAARKGIIASKDADIVTQLRDAGAIVLGTLNMHEAALGASTDNPFFGRGINPHGEGRSPGGSSGGSAAAVAAGLCVAAIGTDTLGSIRIPASYCGVFGLKPSHGAVSDQGVVPVSARFDAVGPIARSMEDIAYLSNILIKPDLSTAMQRSRFLVLGNLGGVSPDPDVRTAYQFVIDQLAPDKPTAISLPHPCGRARVGAFAYAVRDLVADLVDLGPARCDQFSDELTSLLEFGINRGDAMLKEDAKIVLAMADALVKALGTNGLLLLPTTPQTAFLQDGNPPTNMADWTAIANMAGLPALSLPIGRDSDGLPIGLQIIGPPGCEALTIAQARMINDRIKGYTPPPHYW